MTKENNGQFKVSFTKKMYPDIPEIIADIRARSTLLTSDAQAVYVALVQLREALTKNLPLVNMASFNRKRRA